MLYRSSRFSIGSRTASNRGAANSVLGTRFLVAQEQVRSSPENVILSTERGDPRPAPMNSVDPVVCVQMNRAERGCKLRQIVLTAAAAVGFCLVPFAFPVEAPTVGYTERTWQMQD